MELMSTPRYPSLYQINTRVWLTELSRNLGRPATLDDIPDAELDRLAEMGFDWVWFLSVWQTGPAAQRVSRSNAEWRREFQETLPDLREEDIPGSGFAITGYTVHDDLGGDAALARLRERLRKRGLRAHARFCPQSHGARSSLGRRASRAFHRAARSSTWPARRRTTPGSNARSGDLLLAYGRDPYFAGWPDTLQLNYANPATQEAMIGELLKIAGQCDGVRCDMAMLVLPDVFERTWGQRAPLFWPTATQRVREQRSRLPLHGRGLLGPGMDAPATGLRLRLRQAALRPAARGHARPVREHFHAGLDYQNKLARFLENHDEPRAAATFPADVHEAAAVITFLSPGPAVLPSGPVRGAEEAHLAASRSRPERAHRSELQQFYDRLLAVLRSRRARRPVAIAGMRSRPGTATGRTIASWSSPGKTPAAIGCSWR